MNFQEQSLMIFINDKLQNLSLSMHMMIRADSFPCNIVACTSFLMCFSHKNDLYPEQNLLQLD
jgi:hypothetical protein